MYIKTNGQRYRCTGTPTLTGDPLRFTLPEGGPETLGATVELYTDGGFLLRAVDVRGYARHGMDGETLVITSRPEPGPAPEPAPAEMTLEEATAELVADHEYRLSLLELGLGEGGADNGQSA